jgi:hypothetical protein
MSSRKLWNSNISIEASTDLRSLIANYYFKHLHSARSGTRAAPCQGIPKRAACKRASQITFILFGNFKSLGAFKSV